MQEILDITYAEIGVIRELWEKNRQFHEDTSEYFGEEYKGLDFNERINGFGIYGEDEIRISVAKENGEYVGYCISTAKEGKGEVASLHVEKSSRGSGLGRQLVLRHLEWMKGKGCKDIGVTVSQENSATISFYRKLGFYPNTLYMQQKL